MIRIVEIKYNNKSYYAVQYSWLGVYKAYFSTYNYAWWHRISEVTDRCLHLDLVSAQSALTQYLKSVEKPKITVVSISKVEKACNEE